MSSSINKNVNVERRTWDKEAYEARARSRAAAENDGGASIPVASAAGGEPSEAATALKNELEPNEEKEEFLPAAQGRAGPEGSERAFLKSRARKVDLESKLGSTEIIDPAAASATKSKLDDAGAALTPASGVSKCSDGVGWHCRVCDCFLKDSLTYLDHINGRKHQRHLGYSMRVEKSTTEEVSGVLKGLANKKREMESAFANGGAAETEAVDFEDVVRKRDEDAVRRKEERRRKREERKRKEREGSGQVEVVAEAPVEEEAAAAAENPAEEEEEEVEDGGVDPALAAMMGFAGFGGSRK